MAQNDRVALPYSWTSSVDYAAEVPFALLPQVDIGTLMKEDFQQQEDKTLPHRFAHTLDADHGFDQSGKWIQLSNGNRIWFQGFYAQNAQGIGFILDDISIPEGAKLFVYNETRSDVLGAFTDSHNPSAGRMIMPYIEGQKIIIEYFEPAAVRGEGRLSISGANYVYNAPDSIEQDNIADASCQINVQCSDAREWHVSENAAVRITCDNGTRWSSGVLINNSGHKSVPYVITSSDAMMGSPAMMSFTFQYESSDCNTQAMRPKQFISGASVVATDASTGLVLLKLNKAPDPIWDIFYAGWNRSGIIPLEAGCVHHPAGDVKKCAITTGDLITESIWHSEDAWMINRWDLGATDRGSVGAPVFDKTGLVVGFLAGGYSECQASREDFVVKFKDAWDSFGSFLDPDGNSGVSIVGQSPISRPQDERIIESEVAFYPNPARDQVKIYNDNEEAVVLVRVFDMNSRIVDELNLNESTIDVSHLPTGMYVLELQLETFAIRDRLVIYR